MSYRIDGKALSAWAQDRIRPAATKNKPASVARFYCGLVFSFIEHDYSRKGRIETDRTRYSIRKYLAEKKNPTTLSGGLFSSYMADLIENGMADLDDEDKVTLIVPEELVIKGSNGKTVDAARWLLNSALKKLNRTELDEEGFTVDDLVEAVCLVQQAVPFLSRQDRDGLKQKLEAALGQRRAAA